MILVICFLFPSIASLQYFKHDYKDNRNLELLIVYSKLVLMNILSTFSVIYLFSNQKGGTIIFTNSSVSFVIKYLVVSLVFAMLLPPIYKFLSQNIKIEIEAKRKIK